MQGDLQPAYEFGAFCLDVAEQRLLCAGRPLPLTPKVFDVLRVLVQNHGHLVEKERLLAEVWPDSFVEEGALSRSISILRKTLGESDSGQKFIETVPKRGYRFVAVVVERAANGTADSTGRHQSLTLPSSRLFR
jgi:DNA-binding winged helix-turn-helix (wHTH) protein